MGHIVDADIEWFSNEYDKIAKEVNSFLHTKMQDPTHNWELAETYERDLEIEQMALEMQCLAMDDNSQLVNDAGHIKTTASKQEKGILGQKPIFTCALCKMGFVSRKRNQSSQV